MAPHVGQVGQSVDALSAKPAALGAAPRERLLCETLSQLNRDVPPHEWARAALPLIAEALAMDTGAVLRMTGQDDAHVIAAWGLTHKRGYPYAPLDLRDPLLATLTQRCSVVTLDRGELEDVQQPLRALCHPHFGTLVIASAFMGHVAAGLLVFSRHSDRPLTEGEATFLGAVSDAVGMALGTASLSRASSMNEVVLETAVAVARAISGSLDLAQTFRQIAHSGARVMGDCNCLLLQLDGDSDDLVAVACSDPADEVLVGLRVRFEDEGGNRDALARRRCIVVDDLVWGAGTDREYRKRLDIRSALFMPIHSEEGLIGSLLLYSTARRDRYSEDDIARAETVAEQAASAICNARLFRELERSESRATDLLQRNMRLRERQRRSFSNVLHDGIVQTLVATLYQVEGIRAASGESEPEDLDRVAAMLRQAISDARGVIWDLRPPVLDGLGLHGALEALAKRVAKESGIAVDVDLEGADGLPADVNTALYVIAREALQNARKHARARSCSIVLREERSDAGRTGLRMTVRDDGSGFDRDAALIADHFGLTMMDEQAALAGGALALHTSPDAGTTVEVTVPLERTPTGSTRRRE
ncbi:MAG TPA: GAF domain-containing protein [Thermoleophilia bacterium]|nr:GAF domain-containing protein [Thermoleophilia bacterium]